MKRFTNFIILALMCLPVAAQQSGTSAYDLARPAGWATVDGQVTGGNDENPVKVTTLAELKSALTGTAKKTIYVEGTIEFSGIVYIQNVQNKTVYGLPGSVLQNSKHSETVSESGILSFKRCKNIILRNLTFKGAGAYDMDGYDNLELYASTYIWVDHCDFQDGVDGCFDCNNGSDNICVSWCRFRYLIKPWAGGSGGSKDHRFCNNWGGDDKQTNNKGKLRTTFLACWWDEGCKERMPRVRFGKVHVANCLYSSSVTNYCVGGGYLSNVYIDKCIFKGSNAQKYPWKNYATASGKKDYNYTITGCSGAADKQAKSGSNAYFIPSDYYTLNLQDPSVIEPDIRQYAGATLPVEYGKGVTAGISSSSTASDARVVRTEYFTASGTRLSQPQPGINIVRQKLSDGTVKTRKVLY